MDVDTRTQSAACQKRGKNQQTAKYLCGKRFKQNELIALLPAHRRKKQSPILCNRRSQGARQVQSNKMQESVSQMCKTHDRQLFVYDNQYTCSYRNSFGCQPSGVYQRAKLHDNLSNKLYAGAFGHNLFTAPDMNQIELHGDRCYFSRIRFLV